VCCVCVCVCVCACVRARASASANRSVHRRHHGHLTLPITRPNVCRAKHRRTRQPREPLLRFPRVLPSTRHPTTFVSTLCLQATSGPLSGSRGATVKSTLPQLVMLEIAFRCVSVSIFASILARVAQQTPVSPTLSWYMHRSHKKRKKHWLRVARVSSSRRRRTAMPLSVKTRRETHVLTFFCFHVLLGLGNCCNRR
jgi:hypothetical protein